VTLVDPGLPAGDGLDRLLRVRGLYGRARHQERGAGARRLAQLADEFEAGADGGVKKDRVKARPHFVYRCFTCKMPL
jgi:hypothetical protein